MHWLIVLFCTDILLCGHKQNIYYFIKYIIHKKNLVKIHINNALQNSIQKNYLFNFVFFNS